MREKQQYFKLHGSPKLEIFTLTAEKLFNNTLEDCIKLHLPSNSLNSAEKRAGFLIQTTHRVGACRSWKCPDAVRLQTCSHDEACVYISCPAVSTSSLVAVQASPQAQRPFCRICFHIFLQRQNARPDNSDLKITFYRSHFCQKAETKLAALTGTCLCRVFGRHGLTRRGACRHGQEATCADGRLTKGCPPVGRSGSSHGCQQVKQHKVAIVTFLFL